MKNIIFKSKLNNTYVYNNTTGMIFYVDDPSNIATLLAPYEKLVTSQISKHLYTPDSIKASLYQKAKGFDQLILEITDACNFRCKYCIYSDHYKRTRSHGYSFMSVETAQKAVDYFLNSFLVKSKYNSLKAPTITFYGGEPLMSFKLIENIVAYVSEKFPNINVKYSITTNGSLLTEKINSFLSQHKFSVLISLDGYKENHNRNRVDANGNETFDLVFSKYLNLKKNYPDLDVEISCCYDPKTNMQKLAYFFEHNKIPLGILSQVDSSSSTFYDQFSKSDINTFQASYKMELEKFINSISSGQSYHTLPVLEKWFYKLIEQFSTHPIMGNSVSSCMPGEKIYVCFNGNFKICEKVSNSFNIGNVNTGLDYKRISSLLNQFHQIKSQKCSNCEISHICNICFHNCYIDGHVYLSENVCKTLKQNALAFLINYVNISEQNPLAFDSQTSTYYSTCLGGVI